MTARRKTRRRAARLLARLLTIRRAGLFIPGAAAGWWGWHHLGGPYGREGLAVAAGAGLLAWPVLVLGLLAVLTVPHLLVPRRWRIAYRHVHGRDGARSAQIPAHLRRVVMAADRYRCVFCRATARLEVDHILPWAAGGRTWLWNLAVLCKRCNDIKSNYNKDPDGYVHYRPFMGLDSPHQAAAIVRREKRACQYNPVRWARAAWALG